VTTPAAPSALCLRTESPTLVSYDIAVERAVLEPRGIRVVPVNIDDPEAFAVLAPQAEAVLHFRGVLDEARMARLTRCRIIAHYGTGLDRIDVPAATARGIMVTSGPLYAVDEVSSHAIALLLAAARKIVAADRAVREGRWHIPPLRPVHRIAGKVLGLLGFGNIARETARKGRALGLDVVAHDPYVEAAVFAGHNVRGVTLEECLALADFLSIHLPNTPQTQGLVGRAALARMKPSAIVINTSRGAVVDEAALVEALQRGRLAGAGLDVFAQEPLPPDHPLLQLPNVTVTGHVAFYSEESIRQMQREAAEQVVLACDGRVPSYLVNPEVLTAARPGPAR
jgi:D-3-phosphoglycerate dehydrogenase